MYHVLERSSSSNLVHAYMHTGMDADVCVDMCVGVHGDMQCTLSALCASAVACGALEHLNIRHPYCDDQTSQPGKFVPPTHTALVRVCSIDIV